jgi:hypothetical protein
MSESHQPDELIGPQAVADECGESVAWVNSRAGLLPCVVSPAGIVKVRRRDLPEWVAAAVRTREDAPVEGLASLMAGAPRGLRQRVERDRDGRAEFMDGPR